MSFHLSFCPSISLPIFQSTLYVNLLAWLTNTTCSSFSPFIFVRFSNSPSVCP
jgi:hypothetical protein